MSVDMIWFGFQLPPSPQQNIRRRIIERFKKSLFQHGSDPHNLKMELSRVCTFEPIPHQEDKAKCWAVAALGITPTDENAKSYLWYRKYQKYVLRFSSVYFVARESKWKHTPPPPQLVQASPEVMETDSDISDWWRLVHHFPGERHAADDSGTSREGSVRQPRLWLCGCSSRYWCNRSHSWNSEIIRPTIRLIVVVEKTLSLTSNAKIKATDFSSSFQQLTGIWKMVSRTSRCRLVFNHVLVAKHDWLWSLPRQRCVLLCNCSLAGDHRRAAGGEQLLWSNAQQVTILSHR